VTIAGARRDLAAPFFGSPVVRGGIGEEDRDRLNAKGAKLAKGKRKAAAAILLGGRIETKTGGSGSSPLIR
jgi:hypothetical protein